MRKLAEKLALFNWGILPDLLQLKYEAMTENTFRFYRGTCHLFYEDLAAYQKYHQAIATHQAVHFEDHYLPLEKWYEISAYPSVNGLSVYFKDITDRKLSEILLTASEKKYSELFHLSPLPMWVYDTESLEFIDVNDAAVKHYGYSHTEFLAMTILDIRPAEDIAILEKSRARHRY